MINTRNYFLDNSDLGIVFQPFITVARDPGSGGSPIAKAVADKLGYDFYDDKLIEEVAKSAKLRKEVLERVDERHRTAFQDLIQTVINPEYIAESTYLKHLTKIVLGLAHRGKVVMLGRGTNFITSRKFGFHVRITAPYRVCVDRAVKYEEINYQEAREIIREVSKERAAFVKQYFGKVISNPKYYDLTMSTEYFSINDSRDLIISAFHKKKFHNTSL